MIGMKKMYLSSIKDSMQKNESGTFIFLKEGKPIIKRGMLYGVTLYIRMSNKKSTVISL